MVLNLVADELNKPFKAWALTLAIPESMQNATGALAIHELIASHAVLLWHNCPGSLATISATI